MSQTLDGDEQESQKISNHKGGIQMGYLTRSTKLSIILLSVFVVVGLMILNTPNATDYLNQAVMDMLMGGTCVDGNWSAGGNHYRSTGGITGARGNITVDDPIPCDPPGNPRSFAAASVAWVSVLHEGASSSSTAWVQTGWGVFKWNPPGIPKCGTSGSITDGKYVYAETYVGPSIPGGAGMNKRVKPDTTPSSVKYETYRYPVTSETWKFEYNNTAWCTMNALGWNNVNPKKAQFAGEYKGDGSQGPGRSDPNLHCVLKPTPVHDT